MTEKKKGLFKKLADKVEKKMEEKAEQSCCCCGGNEDCNK